MIENADRFTFIGAMFTHQHEVHLFEEGLLIFPLQAPIDRSVAPLASETPVLTEDYLGWHPATRARGAPIRWAFVDGEFRKQFRGQMDGRRSLPAVARAFLSGRFDAQPTLKGTVPIPLELVLCFPVGDTFQVLHWFGGLTMAHICRPSGGAIENLREESLARIHDKRLFTPPEGDAYLGQVLHGKQFAHVFESGVYVQDAAKREETGWYPLRTKGANLSAEGARLLLAGPHLLDAAALGFPFLAGQHDAKEGDAHARYVWVGLDEQGVRQSFMVFDHALLRPGNPGFNARQGETEARAARDAGHFAAPFDPMVISRIDQLERGSNWDVCGFVAAIQAAWHQAGRHDLLKATSHATLLPVMQAFMAAHPELEANLLQDSDVQLSFAELKALMARDTAMRSHAVSFALNRAQQEQLMIQLGLKPDWVMVGAPMPLTIESLPAHSATYSLCDSVGGPTGGHQAYVNPEGKHLLWGRAYSAAEAIELLGKVFDGITDIVRFE